MTDRQPIQAIALLTALLFCSIAGAQPIIVSNTNNAGPGSLRAAMFTANGLPGTRTIEFAPGVTGTIALADNLPTLTGDTVINGPGSDALLIDGGNLYRGLLTDPSNTPAMDLTLSGLTLRGVTVAPGEPYGAAVGFHGGDLVIDDLRIVDSGNKHNDRGMIYAEGDNIHLTDVDILDCEYDGAGVYVYDAVTFSQHGGEIAFNHADAYVGMAINASLSLDITGVRVFGNESARGATLSLLSDSISVSDTSVTDNSLGSGGIPSLTAGVYVSGGSVLMEGVTVARNLNHDYPDALASGLLVFAEDVVMRNSTLADNVGGDSAITADLDTQALMRIEYSTIAGNSAGVDGGGIMQVHGGTLFISGSVVANNTYAGQDRDLMTRHGPGSLLLDYSLVGEPGDTVFSSPTPGSNLIGAQAMLGPLTNNGGSTLTRAPLTGSPLIDAISASVPTCNQFPVDQRSLPRPVGAGCDIGAIEVQLAIFTDGLESPIP